MSILAPSRGDLLSPHPHQHQNLHGSLQLPPPSKPLPPTYASASASISTSTTFTLPSKMDAQVRMKTSNGHNDSHFDVFSAWKQGHSAGTDTFTPKGSREVLASVNTNIGRTDSLSQQSTSKPSARISSANSIPRPAASPDVFFAPDATKSTSFNASRLNSTYSLLSGKRSRDISANASVTSTASTSAKRVKAVHDRDLAETSAKGGSSRSEETEKWRAKWVKAFPTLVFHFEIGAEEGVGRVMRNRVLKMGAKVDQFFSTRVTHLVVKGGVSPQKPKPMSSSRRGDVVRESPKNPFLDGTGVTDLVQKAEAMNMKVWSVKKLADILSKIAPLETTANDSLSTLLEDEKIHGTRERDLSAPRPDYYYFKPGSKYLLIEDAIGKHRTIMVKEYGYDRKEGPEWPTLFDGFLRVSSSMQSNVPPEKVRDRAWTLYVERKPFEGEQPPQDLKRSTSLRALPVTPKLPEAQPYYNASGNSVVLTSNIASTSTANNTPNFGTMPSLGTNKDRAIMQMSKRVQVLKGNARLAAARRSSNDFEYSLPTSTSLSERRASTSYTQPAKTFMTQEQVVKMLQQAREPVAEDTEITVQMRMRNREKVDMGLKGREQDTAAGYCENCRLRYSDLSVHIASKKHRRFAMNDENFEDLDRLLYTLQRPLNPASLDLRYPPCTDAHDKDAECAKCDVVWSPEADGVVGNTSEGDAEYDTEGSESGNGSIFEEEGEEVFVDEQEDGGDEDELV